MNLNYIYQMTVTRFIMLLLMLILACRITHGHIVVLIIIWGLIACWQNKKGIAILCFLALPILNTINVTLMPMSYFFSYYKQIGTILLSLALTIKSKSSIQRHKFPLLDIYCYLVVAAIFSLVGTFPLISLLKIINFGFLILGLYFGMLNIDDNANDIKLIRTAFIAYSLLLIIGSILTLLFPAIAYSTSIPLQFRYADYSIRMSYLQSHSGIRLFTGIANQSQALGPIVVLIIGWLMMDMLLIEHKITITHGIMIFLSPIVLFLTHSRTALFSYIIMWLIILFYILPNSNVESSLRIKIKKRFIAILFFMVIFALFFEFHNSSISYWLRKTTSVQSDSRTLSEAVTESRLNQIDEMFDDFKSSPIYGIGFQVSRDMRNNPGAYTLFSAPVEKGFLPLAILSETGIVGAIVFLGFIIYFAISCTKKYYISTFALFIIFLGTNIGEATFFSPGGMGGLLWCISIIGGSCIDSINNISSLNASITQNQII